MATYKYQGTFKTVRDSDIQVTIMPSNGVFDEVKEIRFGETPVVITLEADDGIFTPLRTRGCTITLFTEEIYWDLYAKDPFQWYVEIKSASNFYYFLGFLTPCVYTQDYAWKGEIELEAVDYFSVLENIEYSPMVDGVRGIYSVLNITSHIWDLMLDLAPSAISPSFGMSNLPVDPRPFLLQEANFFDDDDEETPWNCKEVMEEIFKYFGYVVVPLGRYLNIMHLENLIKDSLYITKTRYADGTPSLEMDDVYNKIELSCNQYEVEDLITDPFEDNKHIANGLKMATNAGLIYSDYGWTSIFNDLDHYYKILVKPYYFTDTSLKGWYACDRSLLTGLASGYSPELIMNLECNWLTSKRDNSKVWCPKYMGAKPIRQFTYKYKEGYENVKNISWEDYVFFPTQYSIVNNPETGEAYPICNMEYNALTYKNPDHIAYSMSSGTGYIVLNCEVFLQDNRYISILGYPTYSAWMRVDDSSSASGKNYFILPCNIEDACLDNDSFNAKAVKTRESSDTDYNKGWQWFKATLKIGDKYWNGTQWTTTASTFPLNFHLQNAESGNNEELRFYDWNKICENPNVKTYEVGEEGYAIPIKSTDLLHGQLEFSISTPINPYSAYGLTCSSGYIMKDFELTYKYKDGTHWADDTTSDDDIVYYSNVASFKGETYDDLELKINSWYYNKPVSKSYILNTDYTPVITINGWVPELKLCNMYFDHYSTPKKKFIVNYKTDYPVAYYYYYHPNILDSDGNPTKFVMESFELDLLKYNTEITFTEL